MKSKNKFYKSKNPHNQFIFDYFNALKMRCIGGARDKLVFGYQKIIMALQKYPLPILTEEQAISIQGVGPKTSCMIVKLLNSTYKDNQNITLQMNDAMLKDVEQDEQTTTDNFNSCPTTFTFRPSQILEGQLDFMNHKPVQRPENQSNKIIQFLPPSINFVTLKTVIGGDPNTQISTSMTTKTKNYVPNRYSKGWGFVLALQQFEDYHDRSFATRKEIKDIAKNFSIDLSSWNVVETLEKFNLISKSVLGDDVKYALTADGKKLADRFQVEYNLEQKALKETQIIKDKDDSDISKAEIILLIDNRERYQSNNRVIIFDKLTNLYNLNCRLVNLPVGDFLWVAKIGKQEYVLDYIVERKTLSDLAHSILDKRYNDQKFKLKNCGLSRLFYLIENSSTGHYGVTKQTVEKAIRNTQVRDGFLIQQTETLEESLLWISTLTKTIKVSNTPSRTLQEFMHSNSSRAQTISHSWGCMIKAISGAGQEVTRSIVERWPTPIKFYEDINRSEDRMSMLQGKETTSKVKDGKVKINQNLARLIEILFTFEVYPDDQPNL